MLSSVSKSRPDVRGPNVAGDALNLGQQSSGISARQ
jgi:hypothetical protein